jgi:hypothetical protein
VAITVESIFSMNKAEANTSGKIRLGFIAPHPYHVAKKPHLNFS